MSQEEKSSGALRGAGEVQAGGIGADAGAAPGVTGAPTGPGAVGAADAGIPGAATSPQRARRKWPIVVGVVAAVLVVAGAGFWVWHEQPSFCNAVCHEPMDAYVEGYYNDPSQMAYVHQLTDTTCLQCHEPKLDEQIGEALVWVRGDFALGEDGKLATVGVRADTSMCATAGCHDLDEVAAATENWGGEEGVNPHDSHQGYGLDCSSCHTAHGQSYMYCNTCHDYEVPEGWAAPVRSQAAGDAR